MGELFTRRGEHVVSGSTYSNQAVELVNINFANFPNADISNGDNPVYDGVTFVAASVDPVNFRIVNGSGMHMHTNRSTGGSDYCRISVDLEQSAIDLDSEREFEVFWIIKNEQFGSSTATRTNMLRTVGSNHNGNVEGRYISQSDGINITPYHRINGSTVEGTTQVIGTTDDTHVRIGFISHRNGDVLCCDTNDATIPGFFDSTRRTKFIQKARGMSTNMTRLRSDQKIVCVNDSMSDGTGNHEFYIQRFILRGHPAS
tara:strand:+ start:54 stop:827 length:774 start_codon:yes stop_codon:yes gene_type:complete